jgi:hypothetical protein
VAAVRANVHEHIGDDEARAREFDGAQCQARPDEFVAAAAGVRDVIADFRMGKHGLFSATGRATHDRVAGVTYVFSGREDSARRRAQRRGSFGSSPIIEDVACRRYY